MTAHELLESLLSCGIELTVDGENVHIRAPKGALTDDMRVAIKTQKAELVAHLRNDERGALLSEIAELEVALGLMHLSIFDTKPIEDIRQRVERLRFVKGGGRFTCGEEPKHEPPKPRCIRCQAFTKHTVSLDEAYPGWEVLTCSSCGKASYAPLVQEEIHRVKKTPPSPKRTPQWNGLTANERLLLRRLDYQPRHRNILKVQVASTMDVETFNQVIGELIASGHVRDRNGLLSVGVCCEKNND